jgi:predicted HicB family RNase H-like nuclease
MPRMIDRLIQEFPALDQRPVRRSKPVKVMLRMSPELRRRLFHLASASDEISMNRLCVTMLEDGVRRVAGS